jgi:UDP-GlcNAc3NAcA epimerase
MRILTVLGARPQFVKAATVSRRLQEAGIEERILHTGQHFDDRMSRVFFEQMGLPCPAHDLGIHGLPHGAMTGRMLEGVEAILLREKPDRVLVYGDTNSTLAGALAARKTRIPVDHVEAGLRSFDLAMPEETNRILTDRLSDWLFCPTKTAVRNLHDEGFARFPCRILETGDVMLDAVREFSPIAERHSSVVRDLGRKEFALATVHRQENTDDLSRLASIVRALNEIHGEMPVVLPAHPRTRRAVDAARLRVDFHATEPASYLEMLDLLAHCRAVLTDSGGLQKEAYFFEKPCVTLRDETEWTELIDAGANVLAGADTERIVAQFRSALSRTVTLDPTLYGDGQASHRIAAALRG